MMEPRENPWPDEATPAPHAVPDVPAPAPLPPGIGQKNPMLAAVLSLFPGMGNIYNGLYLRGLTLFLIIASLIAVAQRHPLLGFSIAFFWLFNVLDAYRQATLINYGYAQDLGLVDLPRHPKAAQGGLIAGVILTLIGLFALLDRFFDIDLGWLFDLWPAGLMAIGLWLVWASLRERRRGAAGR
jgi:cell wall-active antibiotic response 4TMS protein YvqF